MLDRKTDRQPDGWIENIGAWQLLIIYFGNSQIKRAAAKFTLDTSHPAPSDTCYFWYTISAKASKRSRQFPPEDLVCIARAVVYINNI